MSARPSVRAYFLLQALALGAAAGAVPLVVGLPLAGRQLVSPAALALLCATASLAVLALAALLLLRGAAAPVDRLLRSAARFRPAAHELPLLGPDTTALPLGPAGAFGSLARAAVAFERLAAALEEERARLDAKVAELTAANRKLAEARESLVRSEKLATVGRLAAGLAHEIGNPLAAVTGYVELARLRLPASPHPDLVDALDRVAQAASRIDGTVRELLDFARPVPPVLGPVRLAHAVDSALRLARVQARFRHVEALVELSDDLPAVVADAGGVSQVLLNLLLNAGDAMGGEGRVRLMGSVREASRACLTITDTGPGIPAEDLPRIFDPFFTTKDPGAGTGLGLAICQSLMASFGGEITARNGEEGGAVFELTFRAPG